MINNNIKINSSEIKNALEILKANGIAFEIKQPKIVDKFEYDENGLAICRYSNKHFDLSKFNEDIQIQAKKFGIHPDYIEVLKRASEIKSIVKNIRTVKEKPENYVAPGKHIRSLIESILNKKSFTKKIFNQFTDANFSKETLKLNYPLLLDITNKTDDEIKTMKKDSKGHVRYSSQVYTHNKIQFLITNDLYVKHINIIENVFKSLKLIK